MAETPPSTTLTNGTDGPASDAPSAADAAYRAGMEQLAYEARLAQVNGQLHAVQAQQVELIADALREGWWHGDGIVSPEHWVTWKCGVSPRRARDLIRIARRRDELPLTSALFADGRISVDQMTVIARHAPACRDAEVADLARSMTVTQLIRVLRTAPEPVDPPDPDIDGLRPDTGDDADREQNRRHVGIWPADDGGWRLDGWLPDDEGHRLRTVLGAIRDELFRAGERDTDGDAPTNADALAEMVERAAGAGAAGASGRYQSIIHVPVAADHPTMLGGRHLPASLSRYLTCDGKVRPVFELDGRPVALGRSERTVPDRLRHLIEHRDGGCRVPGCRATRVQVHHLVHWEDGGATDPDNLCCLCPKHHRLHHQGRIGISGDPERPDGLVFTNRSGIRLDPGPSCRGPGPHRGPPDVPPYQHPEGGRFRSDDFLWNPIPV